MFKGLSDFKEEICDKVGERFASKSYMQIPLFALKAPLLSTNQKYAYIARSRRKEFMYESNMNIAGANYCQLFPWLLVLAIVYIFA